ncbi:hypothetical protein AC579_1714 [Pseudocercospora musae]|uniref:HMG box domain-containing protein n=1 Tax=Pseudocercospora musae TaxID=113226 RepID=A0A139ICH3_9PEZI|nr:hypothetical protein AC579_1714 [Pseudocercospora musae]
MDAALESIILLMATAPAIDTELRADVRFLLSDEPVPWCNTPDSLRHTSKLAPRNLLLTTLYTSSSQTTLITPSTASDYGNLDRENGLHIHMWNAYFPVLIERIREHHSTMPELWELERESVEFFTFCFVPIIPFSLKPWHCVNCHICHFQQDLKYRPDVQQQMDNPSQAGQQQIPMQNGPPQGWNSGNPYAGQANMSAVQFRRPSILSLDHKAISAATMNPAHLDPRLQTPTDARVNELIEWANKQAVNTPQELQQLQQPQQLQSPMRDRIVVTIDRERFTQTRNALTSAYIGLSNAVDKAVKAYIDHTDVILQGEGTLDISHLLNPFTGAVGAAQTAEFNIANGLHAVTTGTAEALANGDPKKRQKRPYKQRDPNAPKRPLTAYFRYLKEVRPLIAAEVHDHPPSDGTKAGDISKIATERWKALGDARRKPYHQAYQSELAAYEAAVKEYKAAGGNVDAPKTPGDEDEDEDEEDEGDESPAKVVAAADESSSSDDSSSDEEESDSEEEVPVKPPPPPPQAPKKKSSKKNKAAATPVAAVPPPPAPMAAPEPVSSKKRKAPAGEETPATEKKKKKNRKSEVDPASAQLQLESSQPVATPGAEKKEKKKKRKSEAA